jgi:hypothetical protein
MPELVERMQESDDSLVESEEEENDPTSPSARMMESTFEDVAREQREKKATKSDDAEVPNTSGKSI